MITVKQVVKKSELSDFIDFPHTLFRGDKNYVPELHIAQRDLLTPGKHPFHEHSTIQTFLAYRNGEITGRIAAILNNNHNAFSNRKDGFFGFFDLYDDPEVAEKLITEATNWLIGKGLHTMIGPVNPTTNDACGLLVEGFDSPPVAMMTYNKPYYNDLLIANGFVKKFDLLAYNLFTSNVDTRTVALRETLLKRFEKRNILLRNINMKDFRNEVQKVLGVYNAAWQENTGFVPMTEAEFKYLAKDLKMILDQDFCMVAEKDGKVVGFALAIPDINQVLIKIKNGRLLPTGIFKLLFGRKKINYVRIIALGVTEEHRRVGIEAYFYSEIIKRAMEKNIFGGEASWILEDNEMMNKGLRNLNASVYKRYRILEKLI